MSCGEERSNHASNNKRHQSSCKKCKAIEAQVNESDHIQQKDSKDNSLESLESRDSNTEAASRSPGEVAPQLFDMTWIQEVSDHFLQDGWLSWMEPDVGVLIPRDE